MRAVIQRVLEASVIIEGRAIASIGKGLLVFLGVGSNDTGKDIDYLAEKIVNLRIFEDENGKMNFSLMDTGGEALIVSQFTLFGDCRKGRRPSFTGCAPPKEAIEFYENFCSRVRQLGVSVKKGVFQADMKVSLINDGPVTLILDSEKRF